MKYNFFKTLCIISTAVILGGCKKTEITIPPEVATFAGVSSGNYFIQDDPNSVYNITVGASTVSDRDRTINFTVSSPTGAASGTQYTLTKSGSVTIPAGEATGEIAVKGLYSGYPGSDRKDSLVFELTGGDASVAGFNNTFTLIMQKYCNVIMTDYNGVYDIQDYDDAGNPDGGAYQVLLTSGSSSGTTGQVSITGLWGVPNPVVVDIDWTNPASFTTNIADQNWFIHGTYGQVKIRAAGKGSFSSCDNRFIIKYEAYVPNLGSFGVYSSDIQK